MLRKTTAIGAVIIIFLGCTLGTDVNEFEAGNGTEGLFKTPPDPKYKITYFWAYDSLLEPVDMTTPMVNLVDLNGQVIAAVPEAVAERIAMEGSGFLPADPLYVEPDSKAGALVNLANDENWPGARFIELDKNIFPCGISGMGEPLIPFWTVAVDPATLPLGTIIYIPEYDGYPLPPGFTTITGSHIHDGLFYCGDISWSFKGKQIDIFPGTYSNWQDMEQWVNSLSRVPVRIFASPEPFPTPDADHTIPGDKIEAEDYRPGGEGIGYHDSSNGNEGAVYRNDDVDIEYCTDENTGFNVGWLAAGEWLAFEAYAPEGVTASLEIRTACWIDGQSVSLEMDGSDITGPISLPNTGYWQNWTTVTRENMIITPGNHEIKIHFYGNGYNINWIRFTTPGEIPTPTPGTPAPETTPEPALTPGITATPGHGHLPGEAVITTFRGNRRGAYSPTYDDGLWASMAAVWDFHRQYNIKGTVCINTDDWVNNYSDKWQDLTSWLDSGFYRLGSHAHTHPHLPALTEEEIREEALYSNEILFNGTGYKPESLAWCFNDWDQPAADILADYYTAARAADTYQLDEDPFNGGENPSNPRYMALHAYVYGNKYKVSTMNGWIDTAIENNRWLTVNYHGVDHEGWGPVDSARLAEHYAYVASRSGEIWVEGMAEISKYLKEKNSASLTVTGCAPGEINLELTHCLAPLQVYNSTGTFLLYTVDYDYPLTVKIFVYEQWNGASVTQAGVITSREIFNDGDGPYILADIIPNNGTAAVTPQ